MSDHSPRSLTVYAVGDQDREVVLRAIVDQGMFLDGDEGSVPDMLELGRTYEVYEARFEYFSYFADDLRTEAPSAAFELWQAPCYRMGRYIAHVPGAGSFETGCDSDGKPHIDLTALLQQLAAVPAATAVGDWMSGDDRLLGLTVLRALDRCRERETAVAERGDGTEKPGVPLPSALPRDADAATDDEAGPAVPRRDR